MKVITVLVLLSILLPIFAMAEEIPTVNVNTANLEQLQYLFRVGPVLAQRILDDREANGPYTDPNHIRERVKGIGPAFVAYNFDYIKEEGETTATGKLPCYKGKESEEKS